MPATPAALGFLGHLNGISLKIENVSHGFHLLSHTSLTKQWGYALQRRLIPHSTRVALIEPEDKRLATGNPHRQPPATYRDPPEPKLQHTPSEKTKRHDRPAPSTQPLMMNYLIRSRSSNAC